jgi:MYXO-CTERM domain-containing protein
MVTHLAQYPGADNGNANAPTRAADELFYALLALERLDNLADAAFPDPCGQTPAINGFFLRDDVPGTFHQNFAGMTTTFSDYVDPTLTNKEMSQDQVYHLFIGLALVKRLIPASLTVQGKQLRTWAMDQAQRIGRHMSSSGWTIKNPACGNRNVDRGEDARGYSPGTSMALDFMTAGAFVPNPSPLFIGTWPLLRSPGAIVYNDEDNLHMAMAISAIADGWGQTTAQDLATLAGVQDWPAYPLLHRTLWGDQASGFCQTGAALNKRAREMLDELPANGEPASPRPGGAAPHGFTSTHRFVRGKGSAYIGSEGSDGLRYSGVDYLLLHNLYALATPNTWNGNPMGPPCVATDGGVEGGVPGDGGRPGSGLDGGAGAGEDGEDPAGGGKARPGSGSDGGSSGCSSAATHETSSASLFVALVGLAAALRRRVRRQT